MRRFISIFLSSSSRLHMRYGGRLTLTLTLALPLTLTLFPSCEKLEIAGGTPKCVEKKIKDFNKTSHCEDASVSEYYFQKQTVFTFEPGSCGADMATPVYDASCNGLGSLGGIQGNTKINGESFSNAKFVRTVWERQP